MQCQLCAGFNRQAYHRLTRANAVLTGGNELILRQAPWQYGSIPCGSFLVWTHIRSGKTASHLTAMDFRVIFVFWDAGGLAPAKAKRVKSAEKARCQACLPLSSDGIQKDYILIAVSAKIPQAFLECPDLEYCWINSAKIISIRCTKERSKELQELCPGKFHIQNI